MFERVTLHFQNVCDRHTQYTFNIVNQPNQNESRKKVKIEFQVNFLLFKTYII